MSKWVEVRKGGNFVALSEKYNIDPVIARLLINRDIAESDFDLFLNGKLDDMDDFHKIKNLDRVCALIKDKIDARKKIRIIGDYDVDGVCATYILLKSIKRAGGDVDYYLPDRVKDGYGLNVQIVDECIADKVDTIITCDNGISAVDECAKARMAGLCVIVTDHHEVPYHIENDEKNLDLPDADVVCDLKQGGDDYSFKEICGATLAEKIAQGIYELYGIEDKYEFTELSAFAAIEDVMPLVGENRILVKEGLKRLNNTSIPGMRALIEAVELDKKVITAYHVGFILGPCINAAGRMANASLALELLLSSEKDAKDKAIKLKELNDSRKSMTEEGIKRAALLLDGVTMPHVIVSYLEDVHESIIGIIAGRLKELYQRPAIVLTNTEDGIKGSGRSISAYNLFEKLSECKELFSKFGGHAAAAGLSISCSKEEIADRVAKLSQILNSNDGLCEEDFEEKVQIDVVMPFSYITEQLIGEIEELEPFGNGFRGPVFAGRNIRIFGGKVIGANGRTYKCFAMDESGKRMDAIFFGDETRVLEIENTCREDRVFSMLYNPSINEFRGEKNLQVRIKDIR